jgi:hypothetical protein
MRAYVSKSDSFTFIRPPYIECEKLEKCRQNVGLFD